MRSLTEEVVLRLHDGHSFVPCSFIEVGSVDGRGVHRKRRKDMSLESDEENES